MADDTQNSTARKRGRPPKGRNARNHPVTVYLTAHELELVRGLSEKLGGVVSVSAVIGASFRRDLARAGIFYAAGKIEQAFLIAALDAADEEEAELPA